MACESVTFFNIIANGTTWTVIFRTTNFSFLGLQFRFTVNDSLNFVHKEKRQTGEVLRKI